MPPIQSAGARNKTDVVPQIERFKGEVSRVIGAGLRDTLAIITSCVVLALLALALVWTGNEEALQAAGVLLAPTVALALGLFGMNLFGRDGFVKDDRFVTMNVWLSLGLVVLTLSEVAGIAMGIVGSPEQVCFTVGLVQMPGLLLWGLGIISYLRSVNLSLDLIEGERLWPILVFVIVMGSLVVVAAVIVSSPDRSPLTVLVSAPTMIWLGIILSIIAGLTWTFRGGLLVRPLVLLLIAFLIGFGRSMLWVASDFCEGGGLDDVLALESYLLVGAALIEAAKLETIPK
jgi:hypothetical protein